MEQPGSPQKRIVSAPQPAGPPPTPFVSVALAEDEDVEWQWTHRDGKSTVTGYQIIKRTGPTPAP